MVTTPIWPILVAALGGATLGSLLSGILLILNNHLQSKRDDNREQRLFTRQTRIEPLNHIKEAIDEGAKSATNYTVRVRAGLDTDLETMQPYIATVARAQIAATALASPTLTSSLGELTNLMPEFIDGSITLPQLMTSLANIEHQYIELKLQTILKPAPARPWWKI